MIYLQLFLNFLMIGALSFGGGYGMISLVRETVLGHGWLTESEFLSFIAVSESTPGPLAVNMATFIGASQAGLAGSFVATVGVVLPSFVIILLIAAALHSHAVKRRCFMDDSFFLKGRGVTPPLLPAYGSRPYRRGSGAFRG